MPPTKVILYYADWCGHCTHFKPEWEKLKKMSDSTTIFEEYEDGKDSNIIDANQIAGYPTIQIVYDGKKIEYVGQRTADAILEFIKNPNKSSQSGGNRYQYGFSKRKSKNDTSIYYMMKYYKYKAKYANFLEQNGGMHHNKVKTKVNPDYQEKYHKYKAKYQITKNKKN